MLEVSSRVLISPNVLPACHAERVGRAAIAAYTLFAGEDFWHKKTSLLVANKPDDYVWRLGGCVYLSNDMADALEADYPTWLEERETWPVTGDAKHDRHVHPIAIIGGEEIVTDVSWQQMFAWQRRFDGSDIQPPDDAPLVLVGTRESVVE